MGNSCCEFKCLDDILNKPDGYATDSYDMALRLIASLVTAVLSLSLLFFLIHRLRRRKVRLSQGPGGRQLTDEQRAYDGIGYITGSLGYLAGGVGYLGSAGADVDYRYSEAGYPLWKPAGGYFPRGEAPPPYEEAVRGHPHQPSHAQPYHQHHQDNPVSLTLVHNTHVNITQEASEGGGPMERSHRESGPLASHEPLPAPPQLRLVCRQSKSLLVNQVNVVVPGGGGGPGSRKRPAAATGGGRARAVQVARPPEPEQRQPRTHRTIPATLPMATAPQRRGPPTAAPPPTRRADDSDLDDYRSECENCKSLSLENCSDDLLNETMTLQRHPAESEQVFYRTSLTLPAHSKKVRSVTLNGSAHRDSWFMAMQELSSSSDSD